MTNSFASGLDKAFGIHDQALAVRAERTRVLAANLANADTPNYLARDVDFRAALGQVEDRLNGVGVRVTNGRHLAGADAGVVTTAQYRVPEQPSMDGNTVDVHAEKARFLDNALRYQASLQFLNSRIRGLRAAIGGQ